MSAADKRKLDSITNDAVKVAYTQIQDSGTHIGTISIDDVDTEIYVPVLSGGKAEAADTSVVSGVTVKDHNITIANKNISGNRGISTSGDLDAITIGHNTTGGSTVKTVEGKTVSGVVIDAYGHVTQTETSNIVNSATAGDGISIDKTTGNISISHGDTSSLSGAQNADTGNAITSITVDEFGHVTATGTSAFKVPQQAVQSPEANGSATAFIDTIS
jgi:hypothetical protein